jgi:hypothetical protein
MGWQDSITLPIVGGVEGTALGGALSLSDIHQFPECLDVLCGLMKFDIYGIPDDTTFQLQDNALIQFSIWVESFKPILSYNKRGRANRRGKSYGRGKRYSGRRYSRRRK